MPHMKELQQLYKEMKAQASSINDPKIDLDAFKNYIKAAEELRKVDKFGAAKPISEEDKANLLKLHGELAEQIPKILEYKEAPDVQNNDSGFLNSVTNVFRNLTGGENPSGKKQMAELAEKFLALSGKEYNVLQAYDPQNKQSIWELMETNRTLRLDMQGIKMPNAVSGQLNSRIPVTFRNDQGKTITGVFTPASYNTAETDIVNGLRKITDGIQETDAIDKYVKKFFDGVLKAYDNEDKEAFYRFVRCLASPFSKNRLIFSEGTIEDGFQYYIGPDNRQVFDDAGGSVEKAIGSSGMNDLTDLLNKNATLACANDKKGFIGDGLRIDDRNSTMSSMADLLGLGHVLAKSEPATMIGEDRKEIQGTFMRKAEGMDPRDPTDDEAWNVNFESMIDLQDAEKGRVLRDLADIQVLDALALNTDRNDWNLFLRFKDINGKWKAIGAMGIDNDMSYGLKRLNPFRRTGQLAAIEDMKYISDSTADKVLNLDRDAYKYSLYATGRTWKEADYAAKRLNRIKLAIKHGKIQRVKDDEWANINVEDILTEFENYRQTNNIKQGDDLDKDNIFVRAATNAHFALENYQNNQNEGIQHKTLEERVNGVVNEYNHATVEGLDAATKKIKENLDVLSSFSATDNKVNAQITELRQDLKNLVEFQENLLKRVEEASDPSLVNQPNYSKDLKAVITPDDLMDIDEMQKTITEKLRVICKEPNHFKLAEKIYDTMKSLELRPEEARTATVNTLHAQDRLKQRQGEKGLQAARLAIGLDTLKIHKEAPKLDGGHQSKITKFAQKKIEDIESLKKKQEKPLNNIASKAAKQRKEKDKKMPVNGRINAQKVTLNKPITKVPTKSKNVMKQNNRMSPRNAGMS